MKELVIFDIDGTLLKGQSQKLFLAYLFSTNRINLIFYFRLMCWFILYKVGLVKDPKRPMMYAYSFLKDRSVDEVSYWAHEFFEKKLKYAIFSDAIEIINEHRRLGRGIILVSNAMEPIVKEVAHYFNIVDYISTKLEIINGVYTGDIVDMMYGEYKVDAVKRYVLDNHVNTENVWAYGDHVTDEPLLSLVSHPYMVNASRSLLTLTRSRNWPSLAFKECVK